MNCYWCSDNCETSIGFYIIAESRLNAIQLYCAETYCDYIDARGYIVYKNVPRHIVPGIIYGPCKDLENMGLRYNDGYGTEIDNITGNPIIENDESYFYEVIVDIEGIKTNA